jgi:oligopeptide transport system substrate-binding protein
VGRTPRSRWFTSLAILAAGSLALSACSSDSTNEPTTSTPSSTSGSEAASGATTGIVTMHASEPQNPLIPTNTTETGGSRPLELLFSGLVYYDAEGVTQNEVAESITTTDGQTYDIKIQPNWKFTNGEAVTASSFVDAWNYGALVTNAQLNSSWFADIEGYDEVSACGATDPESGACTEPAPTAETMSGLTVVSDTEFTVKLSSPQPDFPLRLGYEAFVPMAPAALADMEAAGQAPIGNGPYKFVSWEPSAKISIVANPDYKGPRTAMNGGVDFMFYASAESAYTDLLADNLDVIETIPPNSLTSYEADLGDRAHKQAYAGTTTMAIPVTLEHFGMDEEGRLRRAAISRAIDREGIIAAIYNNTREPAKDFAAPSLPGYSDSLEGSEVLEFDEQAAKDLWAQANEISPWSGTFKFAYNADGAHQEWSEAVVNSIKNTLQIDAEPLPVATFADFRTQVTGGTIGAASRHGWFADYPSIYNMLQPLFGTGAGSNDSKYTNPEFDALLLQGLQADSEDEALKLFQQAEEILLKDLPDVPLWYSTVLGGNSTKVSNLRFDWHGEPVLNEVLKP